MLEHYIKNTLQIPSHYASSVASLFREKTLRKKDYLVRKGGFCKQMIFIESGYLRCHFQNDDKEITYWIYWAGHLVTDSSSFFLSMPAKWHLQALTDCKVYAISQQNYLKIKELAPVWESSEKLFLVKLLTSLEKRVYALLSMTAEERYTFLYRSHKELFNQVPLKHIASMLKITPETLSRIRSNSNS
ncbi:Crp/Fnr family transcriptional regulator [uncultured Microscilla sp.]|uniref:Crp/Fnr family transcriptional regulator n=1 Tax=uncultured Microscilla sp. TaxID=432653 RepID=UPI00263474C8|nr:Crp/Fnr family transcriptional regulator [uncultured Microscilla sp.]